MAVRHRGLQAVYRFTADMRRDAGQPTDAVPNRQPDGQLHRSRVCQPRPIKVLILVGSIDASPGGERMQTPRYTTVTSPTWAHHRS